MKRIDVITPFDFCDNCNNCKLEEIQTYIRPFTYGWRYACKHRKICKNAIELYKKDKEA